MSYRQFSLFVGDLDDDVVEDDLQHYFNEKLESTEAVLSTKVCRDYNNPYKSLGYGYLNFSRQEHVDKALELLNYQTMPGKNKPYRLSRYQPDQSKRKTGEGNVFVNNLPTTFDSKKLHDIFSEYGVIVSCRISEHHGPAKGKHGYVQYESKEEADKAIEKKNNYTVEQQQITVEQYRPQSAIIHKGVFISNLHITIVEDTLRDEMGRYGKVTRITLREARNISGRRYAFVTFEEENEAQRCVQEQNQKTIPLEGITEENYDIFKVGVTIAYSRFEREKYKRQLREKTRFRNLYVRGFPIDYADTDLNTLFNKYGQITSVKVMRNEQGVSRGFGFCCFEKDEEAALALKQLKGKVIDGTTDELIVNYCQTREERTATYRRRLQARQQTHNRQQPQQQNQQTFQGYNRSRQMNQQGFNANNQGQQQNIMNMNMINTLMMQALQRMNLMNPMNFNPQFYSQFFNPYNQIQPPLQPNPLPQQNIQGPVEQQNNIPSFQSSPQDSNNEAPEPLIQQHTIQQGPQHPDQIRNFTSPQVGNIGPGQQGLFTPNMLGQQQMHQQILQQQGPPPQNQFRAPFQAGQQGPGPNQQGYYQSYHQQGIQGPVNQFPGNMQQYGGMGQQRYNQRRSQGIGNQYGGGVQGGYHVGPGQYNNYQYGQHNRQLQQMNLQQQQRFVYSSAGSMQPQPLQQQLIPQLNPIHSQGEQILPTPLDQNTQSSGSLSPQQAQTTPSISQLSGDGTPATVSAQVAGVIRSAGLAPVMIDQQQLGQMAEEEQKQNLGEYLFTQITKIDETNSGKITGMLLELEVVDLVKLLEDPAELVNKVQEAQQVLVDAQKNGQIDDSE